MIRVDNHGDREHAGVREDLQVDGHISTLANSGRYSCADLVPAERYRLGGTADMRDKRVESVLVVHVEPVAPKPCEEPEYPTKNRDGRWTARCRSVGMHGRLNLRETCSTNPPWSGRRRASGSPDCPPPALHPAGDRRPAR